MILALLWASHDTYTAAVPPGTGRSYATAPRWKRPVVRAVFVAGLLFARLAVYAVTLWGRLRAIGEDFRANLGKLEAEAYEAQKTKNLIDALATGAQMPTIEVHTWRGPDYSVKRIVELPLGDTPPYLQ